MNFTTIDCSCEKCASMCQGSTCLPDPAGARRMIQAGLGPRMASYRFLPGPNAPRYLGPAPQGFEGGRDLRHTRYGACTFFKDGLCELHQIGLKPLEGQISHHDRDWAPVRIETLGTWKGKTWMGLLTKLNRAVKNDEARDQ